MTEIARRKQEAAIQSTCRRFLRVGDIEGAAHIEIAECINESVADSTCAGKINFSYIDAGASISSRRVPNSLAQDRTMVRNFEMGMSVRVRPGSAAALT